MKKADSYHANESEFQKELYILMSCRRTYKNFYLNTQVLISTDDNVLTCLDEILSQHRSLKTIRLNLFSIDCFEQNKINAILSDIFNSIAY